MTAAPRKKIRRFLLVIFVLALVAVLGVTRFRSPDQSTVSALVCLYPQRLYALSEQVGEQPLFPGDMPLMDRLLCARYRINHVSQSSSHGLIFFDFFSWEPEGFVRLVLCGCLPAYLTLYTYRAFPIFYGRRDVFVIQNCYSKLLARN